MCEKVSTEKENLNRRIREQNTAKGRNNADKQQLGNATTWHKRGQEFDYSTNKSRNYRFIQVSTIQAHHNTRLKESHRIFFKISEIKTKTEN